MNQNKLTSLQIYIIDNHMKLSYYVKGMSWHTIQQYLVLIHLLMKTYLI